MLDPKNDMQFREATEIIQNSSTKMELAGNGYIYGYFKGVNSSDKTKYVPVLNIPMLSDERWNELAAKCRGMGAGA